MPGNDKYDDDDHIARLLAEDAKKSSQRYASAGLSALLPRRSTKAAPKPNTRFLSHLVREVDSHNAALKKKEESEARIRLTELKGRDSRHQDRDEGRERKRRRIHEGSKESHRRDRSGDRRRSRSPRRHEDEVEKQRNRASHSRREQRRHRSRSTSPREEDKVRDRLNEKHRGRTSHEHRDERQHHRRSHKRSSSSPGQSPNRPPSRHKRSSHHHQHRKRSRSRSPTPRSTSNSPISSDPLESFLNPNNDKLNPQPRIRGRGGQTTTNSILKSKSNIDRHFSTSYDPALDVHPSSSPSPGPDQDRSDWDLALSALRDRATWKKTQAQRLRDAGFGEEEIRKWEKQAMPEKDRDGDVRNVKWAKKGEAREWDQGKKGVDHDWDG